MWNQYQWREFDFQWVLHDYSLVPDNLDQFCFIHIYIYINKNLQSTYNILTALALREADIIIKI